MSTSRLEIGRQIAAELSGDRALGLAREITDFARPPGSSGYHAVTNLVATTLREYGLEEASRDTYPLDGETIAGGSPLPLAWEPGPARVEVVAPAPWLVVDGAETPSALAWWSAPTPPEGLTAELVSVGQGLSDHDFEHVDITGKIVLIDHTEMPAAWSHAAVEAMKRGAAGILTDYLFYEFPPERTRQSLPNAVQLLRLPNAHGEYAAWACAISHPAAEKLRHLLMLGTVKIHAEIGSALFAGTGVNLISTVPGRDPDGEAVYFVSHCTAGTRPGANCAAGPALMVEIERTIATLISNGTLERPKRDLKFLYLIEGLGSRVFFDNPPEQASLIRAAYVLDSVGHSQDKLRSALLYYRHPDSSPSFVNDHFAEIMDHAFTGREWVFGNSTRIPDVVFKQAPYTPWSDNHYWAAMKVPTALLMSWPDRFFHTQLLTADNLDANVFRAAGVSAAVAAYEIADADGTWAKRVAADVYRRAIDRIRAVAIAEPTGDVLASPTSVSGAAADRIAYLAERDAAAIRGLAAFRAEGHDGRSADGVTPLADDLVRLIPRSVHHSGRASSSPADDDGEVVLERASGIEVASALDGLPFSRLNEVAHLLIAAEPLAVFDSLRPIGDEFWNLVDGTRSVAEICRAISLQFELHVPMAVGVALAQGLIDAGKAVARSTR